MTIRLGAKNREQSREVRTFSGGFDLPSRHRSRPRQVARGQPYPRIGVGLHHRRWLSPGVPGTSHTLDGGERRDAYLDALARMLSLQQGQEMASQQPKISGGGPLFSHPPKGGGHLVDASGAQS
jgi:hypothetical protein